MNLRADRPISQGSYRRDVPGTPDAMPSTPAASPPDPQDEAMAWGGRYGRIALALTVGLVVLGILGLLVYFFVVL